MRASRDILLESWDPIYIYATVKARNFKFGMQIDLTKSAKLGQRGSWAVKWPTIKILAPLHISGRLKIESITLARSYIEWWLNIALQRQNIYPVAMLILTDYAFITNVHKPNGPKCNMTKQQYVRAHM